MVTSNASPVKLAFREKLVGGKSQTTDTYLRKLKILHAQLSELDQETADVKTLDTVRRDLLHPSILLHTDRGVKAYAACCIVDILGLYAPEAPYTEAQLGDIFKFVTLQLRHGLKSPSDTYFPQYFHVLESLSTVKSVVLVCDLPNADELIHTFFRDFFAFVRNDHSKQVETFMADILAALIDEANSVPPKCMEIILAQFTEKNIVSELASFRLAVTVCRAVDDKLQRYVGHYFTDTIADNAEEEDLTEIGKAHELIKHIHKYCPALLNTVIPQLEDELKAESLPLRMLITETLGEMYADNSGIELSKRHNAVFKTWLGRLNDRVASIRIKCIEATRAIINNHAELRDQIREVVKAKFLDPDERVRAALCKVYGQLDFEIVLHNIPLADLQDIFARAADKKQSVRTESLRTLAKFYDLAYPQIENQDPDAIEKFAWIPNDILPLYSLTLEGRPVVEQMLADYILPLPSSKDKVEVDEARWTNRLLTTMRYMSNEKAINALLVCTNLKNGPLPPAQRLLDACIKNNGGIIDENEEVVVQTLARFIKLHATQYPDFSKATEDLQTFADLNDKTLYSLLRKCMDPQIDVKTLAKRRDEFNKKMAAASVGAAPTMKIFLRRATYHIVNQSSIPTLLERIERGQDSENGSEDGLRAKHARTLVRYAAKHLPTLFKQHQALLNQTIADEEKTLVTAAALQALASLTRADPTSGTSDKRLIERYSRFAIGTGEKHAKFAARLLAHTPDQVVACENTIETIAEGLLTDAPEILVAHVAALAQFSGSARDAFDSKSERIMNFLVKDLIMDPHPKPDDVDDDEEWAEDVDFPDVYRARVLALKVFRNRCRAYASSKKADLVSGPPLKIFHSLIVGNGSVKGGEDPILMSRMRLQAAVALVQLSEVAKYGAAILPHFQRIALVSQDPCFNVRHIFLKKLIPLLYRLNLPPVYHIIPFLTVHDPEQEQKTTATNYLIGHVKRLHPEVRAKFFDHMFIRYLHFLAHHPDMTGEEEDLKDFVKYLQHFLDVVATPDNISLLYHYAQKGKTVLDADQTSQVKFWMMCELAQEVIRALREARQWMLPVYPGKVRLPGDILKPHKSVEDANKTVSTRYLPKGTDVWVKALWKPSTEDKKDKRAAKRKAVTTGNGDGNTKRPRRKRKSTRKANDSDEDDGDEDEDDASSMVASSDVEMAAVEQEDEEEEDGAEETLGRGARQKAKKRAKRAFAK